MQQGRSGQRHFSVRPVISDRTLQRATRAQSRDAAGHVIESWSPLNDRRGRGDTGTRLTQRGSSPSGDISQDPPGCDSRPFPAVSDRSAISPVLGSVCRQRAINSGPTPRRRRRQRTTFRSVRAARRTAGEDLPPRGPPRPAPPSASPSVDRRRPVLHTSAAGGDARRRRPGPARAAGRGPGDTTP